MHVGRAWLCRCCLAGRASAGEPWLAPATCSVRHDIQLLVDEGVIDLPMSTWPIAASDLAHALASALPRRTRSPIARRSRRRSARTIAQQLRAGSPAVDIAPEGRPDDWVSSSSGAARPTVLRTFADTPREEGELTGYGERIPRVTLGWATRGHRRSPIRTTTRPCDSTAVVRRRQVRQLDRHAGCAGALVGLGLGGQPDPVEQCATGAGNCARSRRLGAVRDEMAELDRSVASDDIHGTDGRRPRGLRPPVAVRACA